MKKIKVEKKSRKAAFVGESKEYEHYVISKQEEVSSDEFMRILKEKERILEPVSIKVLMSTEISIVEHLSQGKTVSVPYLGKFTPIITPASKSRPVDEMVLSVRFTPCNDMKKRMKAARFEE